MTKKQSLQSYAGTAVSPSRSREQIEELLSRVGAVGFRWSSHTLLPGHETLEAGLNLEGRQLAFRLRVTFEDDRERKQKMRALYWYLKTKVEAILFGIVDLEQEFFPYMLTAQGLTIYEEMGGPDTPLLTAGREEERSA